MIINFYFRFIPSKLLAIQKLLTIVKMLDSWEVNWNRNNIQCWTITFWRNNLKLDRLETSGKYYKVEKFTSRIFISYLLLIINPLTFISASEEFSLDVSFNPASFYSYLTQGSKSFDINYKLKVYFLIGKIYKWSLKNIGNENIYHLQYYLHYFISVKHVLILFILVVYEKNQAKLEVNSQYVLVNLSIK